MGSNFPWSFIALALACWGGPSVPAQEREALTLSLDRAVSLALEQSLNLQKNYMDIQNADRAAKNLWALVFPEISAGAGISYRSPLFTDPGLQGDRQNFSYNGSLGITVQFSAALASSMRILALAYQTQLLTYASARKQLEIQVAKTFYTLLTLKRNLTHWEEMQRLAELQFERNQTAFANGLISQRVLLQSRLGAEAAKFSRLQAVSIYNRQLGEFLVLLGLEHDAEAVLVGSLAIERIEADPEELILRYLAKRPDIISGRQTIERLELLSQRIALNARSPSLNLAAQWNGSGTGDSGFTDALSGSLSVRIPLDPWIPGGLSSQSIQTARSEVEKARLDLKNTETQAKMAIYSLTGDLRTSWDSIEIARLRLETAERTYALTEQGFKNGAVESLVLEDARNALSLARRQLLEEELAYKTKALDLAAALNIEWYAETL
ncbi:MAG: TolC family protein [Treponema sp.]|nr:TolC family protein [Treponema sp.]